MAITKAGDINKFSMSSVTFIAKTWRLAPRSYLKNIKRAVVNSHLLRNFARLYNKHGINGF